MTRYCHDPYRDLKYISFLKNKKEMRYAHYGILLKISNATVTKIFELNMSINISITINTQKLIK